MSNDQKKSHWLSTNIMRESDELEELGFSNDPVTGEICEFNANFFARYIQKHLQLRYSPDSYFYINRNGVWVKLSDDVLLQILRNILQKPRFGVWTSRRENEYIVALKRELLLKDGFNLNKNLINMRNGVFDVSTMEFRDHSLEDYSTVQIPISYEPEARCPRFLQFLNEIFEGDTQRIAVAQEWVGICLTPDTKAQKAMIFLGGGANGKGVMMYIMEQLVGADNISHVPLNELSRGFARVRLFGKLLNMSSENENSGNSLNTQYFKAIVGEDIIEAEEKCKPMFAFQPIVKMTFAMNTLPYTKDRSDGFFRRLMILRFTAYFPEKKRDKYLKEKLCEELPGIFNWALEGLERLRKNNYSFTQCPDMQQALYDYTAELNPVLDFIRIRIKPISGSREINSRVYHDFLKWARTNGHMGFCNISVHKFWREFESSAKSLGIVTKTEHSNSLRFHSGIKLVGDFQEPEGCKSVDELFQDDPEGRI